MPARRRRARLVVAAVLAGASFLACSEEDASGPGSTAVSDVPPTTAAGSTSGAFPAQPEGVPWPADDWAERPWPAGVDRAAVDVATERAFAGGAAERVRAVFIVHGGAKVYERYSPHPDDGPNGVMPSYSIAKSVTSAIIGILVREGRLDIDEPAAVPEWHEAPALDG